MNDKIIKWDSYKSNDSKFKDVLTLNKMHIKRIEKIEMPDNKHTTEDCHFAEISMERKSNQSESICENY